MKDSFLDLLVVNFKNIIPFLLSLFFVLFGFVAFRLPLSHYLRPDFGIICVYFWTLYRPDLYGIVSAAILGFTVDIISGGALGINMFILSFVCLITCIYTNFVQAKPFVISWISFAFICFVSLFIKWGILSLYNRQMLPANYIFMIYSGTILIYPLIARINIYVQNRYLSEPEAIDE